MIKKLLLATTLTLSAQALKLEKGETFEANYIQGDVSVTCFSSEGTRSARYRCSESYLNPSDFSRVVSETAVDADKVELTYIDDNGKERTKSSKFSGNKSKSEFNLWIWTLTQRPLLKVGENQISYNLTKKNQTVEQGIMNVSVEEAPTRYCRPRSYTSNFAADCSNGGNICGRYFREMNFCR